MNKILEEVQRSLPDDVKSKRLVGVEKKAADPRKASYDLTLEQLAGVYLAGSDRSKKPDASPVVIQLVDQRRGVNALIPWIIASVAFLITALSLFSTKRIFIDVQVVDDATLSRQRTEARRAPAPPLPAGPRTAATVLSPLDFVFDGGGRLNSSKTSAELTLVNSSLAPYARAHHYFRVPADLTGQRLVFEARGSQGGEGVAFSLKDRNNVNAFAKTKYHPFPDGLTTDWQTAEIPLTDLAPEFDPRGVSALRVDFGAKETGNQPGDTVFLRNIRFVRG